MGNRVEEGLCPACGDELLLLPEQRLETKDLFCTKCWTDLEVQAKKAIANRKEKHGLAGAKGYATRMKIPFTGSKK